MKRVRGDDSLTKGRGSGTVSGSGIGNGNGILAILGNSSIGEVSYYERVIATRSKSRRGERGERGGITINDRQEKRKYNTPYDVLFQHENEIQVKEEMGWSKRG